MIRALRKFMVFLAPMVLGAFIGGPASALTTQQKTEAFALNGCYVNGAFISSPSTIVLGDFEVYTDLLSGSYTSNDLRLAQNLGSGYQSVKTNCSTLLGVYVFRDRGLPTNKMGEDEAGEDARKEVLYKMGYEEVETGDICYHFPVSVNVSDTYAGNIDYNFISRSLCAASDDTIPNSTNIYSTDTSDEDTSKLVPGYTNPVKISIKKKGIKITRVNNSFTGKTETFKFSDYTTFGSMITAIKNFVMESYTPPIVREDGNDDAGYTTTTYSYDIGVSIGPIPAGNTYAAEYMTGRTASDALRALNRLYGIENINELELTSEEKKELYISYLIGFYDLDVKKADEVEESDATKTGYVKVTGSGSLSCWAKSLIDDPVNISTIPVGVNGGYLNKDGTWQELIAELGADVICDEDSFVDGTVRPSDPGDGDSAFKCSDFKGAKSLGWIVCPIVQWLQDAAEDTYEHYVEPNLLVDTNLFETSDSDVGTWEAWGVFRDFANICFIILFLVIIYSQLTGVGIDNYGIKKILPKMIVAALLINLSYWLCIILVDISNIVGSGMLDLFRNLGTTRGPDVELGDGISFNTGSTILVSVGLISALAGASAIFANPAMLLTLLVSMIGVVISVFFLFVLLTARESAIVVLIVVSPLAFVLYMLPNTKRIMDKWWKLFSGLLLVYPICGLLVGGGNYVSRLLLSVLPNDNFLPAFTAMITGIIPIFFIPTVLKSSFAAFGKVGANLANMGNRASSAATGKIKSNEGYKAAQTRGLEHRTRVKAGINRKGQVTRLGAARAALAGGWLGRVTGYQNLQAARVAAANKNRERDIQAGAELRDIGLKYDNAKNLTDEESYFTQKLEHARDRGDTNEMFAVIEQAKRSNMQASHIANMTRSVLGGEKLGNMTDGQRKNFLEEFGKRYGNDFLKKDFEQANWARRGGVGNVMKNGVATTGVAALAGWANGSLDPATGAGERNINLDDMKDEDVASLSSDRLYELIDSGAISQSQAQRVWASNSNMDDAGRLILGAWGNDGNKINKQYAQKALSIPKSGGPLTADNNKGEKATQSIDRRQVDAWTRRAAQASVIEDVAIRNVQNGSNVQTDELRTDMGATGASMAGSLQNIAQHTQSIEGHTENIQNTSAATAASTAAGNVYAATTAANTGSIDKTTKAMSSEVTRSADEAGRAADAAEKNADNTTLMVPHVKRAADGIEQHAKTNDAHHQQETELLSDSFVVGMNNDELGDLASNPTLSNDDPKVKAAQREWDRRDRNGLL